MEHDNSLEHPSTDHQEQNAPHQPKRPRILLSCGPCRSSKLKCDREKPCSQCAKKNRGGDCVYAPKPEKRRPAKAMAARLKHLEGMVREMIDNQSAPNPIRQDAGSGNALPVHDRVLREGDATTFVGATHCMAMLEDIEEMQSYFDEPEGHEDDGPLTNDIESSGISLLPKVGMNNREGLLEQLPNRNTADRLVMKYLSMMTPSQYIIHRPSFTRTYTTFWKNPDDVHLHWIAQLFMMLSLGVFYSHRINAHEMEGDAPIPKSDRIRHCRQCAGYALSMGKYTQPCQATLPAFILYVESEFIYSRVAQMNCYLLSGVCIRLMLKMGLHRDPSKLANMSPFESEMRRRQWNMAFQIDLLVSFHMGLPSMIQGIESDTDVPRNLQDDDFDEGSTELPAERPPTDYTNVTYPIWKSKMMKIFGQIARQVHALSAPTYNEVLRLDGLLEATWKEVPNILKFRPLDECIGEAPLLLTQRFGLGALYNKSRCVLHRRYLMEETPRQEHDYSRKQCLDGALTLLEHQYLIWEACKPGHILGQSGWLPTSLSVHDYLLAAICIYLVIKNNHYPEEGGSSDWSIQQTKTPSKEELKNMMERSHAIWQDVAITIAEYKKAADTLAVMLARIGRPVSRVVGTAAAAAAAASISDQKPFRQAINTNTDTGSVCIGIGSWLPSMHAGSLSGLDPTNPLSSLDLGASISGPESIQATPYSYTFPQTTTTSNAAPAGVEFPDVTTADHVLSFDPSWMLQGPWTG